MEHLCGSTNTPGAMVGPFAAQVEVPFQRTLGELEWLAHSLLRHQRVQVIPKDMEVPIHLRFSASSLKLREHVRWKFQQPIVELQDESSALVSVASQVSTVLDSVMTAERPDPAVVQLVVAAVTAATEAALVVQSRT